ncbi:MAG: hypothetical protein U9P72_02700 [Campylobacterota bacterium]|nr:hypothetical protein [Campylobacterota bacterium]
MAKKKKSIELTNKKISFKRENVSYKVIRFYPTAMSLDVMVEDDDGTKGGMQNIPYAHAPKDVKKLIKPN